jgi:hypothetical protein
MSYNHLSVSTSKKASCLFPDLELVPEVKSDILFVWLDPENRVQLGRICKQLAAVFSQDHFKDCLSQDYPELEKSRFEFKLLCADFPHVWAKVAYCALSRGAFKVNNSFYAEVSLTIEKRLQKEKIAPAEAWKAEWLDYFSGDYWLLPFDETAEAYCKMAEEIQGWTPEQSLTESLVNYQHQLNFELSSAKEVLAAPANADALEKVLQLINNNKPQLSEEVCDQILLRVNGCSADVRDYIWQSLYETCGRCSTEDNWAQHHFSEFLNNFDCIIQMEWSFLQTLSVSVSESEGYFVPEPPVNFQ